MPSVSRFQQLLGQFFYDADEAVGPFLELAPEIDPNLAAVTTETPEDFLAFALEAETYAVPITQVREIFKVPAITEVPRAASNILGVMNVRGDMVPVYDLKKRLQLVDAVPRIRDGQDVPRSSRVVLVRDPHGDAGIVVDRIQGVVKLALSKLEVAPNLGLERHCVSGLGRKDDELFILLDLGQALA